MVSVGHTLRTERQSQKRELAEISEELCISLSYLTAIEADTIKNLPGTFFYKSFVSQYCVTLGLDYAKVRAGVDSLTATHDGDVIAATQVPLANEKAVTRRRSPIRVPDPIIEAANKLDISGRSLGLSVAGLAVALFACSSFYSWWNHAGRAAESETAAQTSSSATASDQMKPISNVAGEANAPGLDVTTSTGADGIRRVALNLSATETTWLSVTSDGKTVFEGKLSPSESKTLEGLEVARIKVGNAGGLDIRWNGKEIGPIGKSGQVRTVLLTPEDVRILTEFVPPAPAVVPNTTEPL